jgi:hypothetical protein
MVEEEIICPRQESAIHPLNDLYIGSGWTGYPHPISFDVRDNNIIPISEKHATARLSSTTGRGVCRNDETAA